MKKLLYPTLLFILIACTPKPQDQNLEIARSYLESHPDSTLIYLNQLIPSNLNTKKYIDYLLISIQARHKTNQDISGDTLLLNYTDYFRKFPDEKAAWLHFYAGKIYQSQEKTDQAIREYMKSERLLKNDPYLSAMLQFSQAELHMNKLETESAISLFQSSVHTFKQIEKFFNASVCYNQIANCYLIEDNPDSVYTYYQECLQYRNYWTTSEEVKMLTNIAFGYRIMDQPHKASDYLKEVLSLPIDKNDQAFIHYHLANLYPSNPDLFLEHIHYALKLLSQREDTSRLIIQLYLSLANFHAAQSNYEAALENHRQYSHYLSETIQGNYDTTIKELRQDNQIRQLKTENLELQLSRHRRTILRITLSFICILGVIAVVRKQKRHKEQLAEAKDKLCSLKRWQLRLEKKKHRCVM